MITLKKILNEVLTVARWLWMAKWAIARLLVLMVLWPLIGFFVLRILRREAWYERIAPWNIRCDDALSLGYVWSFVCTVVVVCAA